MRRPLRIRTAAPCALILASLALTSADALAAAPVARQSSSAAGHHQRSSGKARNACRRAHRRHRHGACHRSRRASRPSHRVRSHTTLVAAPQSSAAAVAAILATPCANTEAIPQPGNLDVVRAAVLCLINRERAQNGEAPLRPSASLDAAAEGHDAEMLAQDYFAHVSPSGETPVERVRQTGYIPSPLDGYVVGENLAWGTYQLATPQAIVSAWIASPGHLANILESKYTETGIGVAAAVPASLSGGAPGATYAQEFGVIIP